MSIYSSNLEYFQDFHACIMQILEINCLNLTISLNFFITIHSACNFYDSKEQLISKRQVNKPSVRLKHTSLSTSGNLSYLYHLCCQLLCKSSLFLLNPSVMGRM